MLPIITHDQRLSRDGVKMQVWGPPKIGKTSLAATCNPADTLFWDIEKGMQSIRGWKGNSLAPESWQEIKNLTCFFAGPDHGVFGAGADYGPAHYQAMCNQYGDPRQIEAYKTLFIDSTTVISQKALMWAADHPEAFTKEGKRDTRGMYGVLSRELTTWAWRLQNMPRLNVILIGGIKQDDGAQWVPMVDGGAALKFPYIFDLIATMAAVPDPSGQDMRYLICRSPNPWRYPAGGRFPFLSPLELPDIDAIIRKVESSS